MDISQRIKEQRNRLGITQQQLAFDTGLSIDGIRSIESGRAKPNIDTLKKLADRFGCTTDYLISGISLPPEIVEQIVNDAAREFNVDLSKPGNAEKLTKIIKLTLELSRFNDKPNDKDTH